ncbi:MAG: hemerythrin domain-containing protein [Polyangiaceae bacterium]
MKVTDDLRHDHAVFLVALELLDAVVAALDKSDAEAEGHLAGLLEFFSSFVDYCHHGKEEECLFPALEKCGLPRDGGPIGVMLSEHEFGRALLHQMRGALARLGEGDATARADLREAARGYHAFLQAHIYKENNVLFAMADRFVPADAAAALDDACDVIERERGSRRQSYSQMLDGLRVRYGVALSAPT